MHDLSENTRRILDGCTAALAAAAALSLNQVALLVTIAAGLVSIACGAVRLIDWVERRRARRTAH